MPTLENGDRQILGTHWPACLAKLVTSMFSEEPHLKNEVGIEEIIRYLSTSDFCTHVHTCIHNTHVDTYMSIHTTHTHTFLGSNPREAYDRYNSPSL